MKFLLYAFAIETLPDFVSTIFIFEKLYTENINHHNPDFEIAILDARAVSIPNISGPKRIITKDSIKSVPPPK